uniref:Uncharacterized protein n=1 Tax=Anguilla anguilla TaxID=7936 RepID=A0A0E9UNE0_ANGAN
MHDSFAVKCNDLDTLFE